MILAEHQRQLRAVLVEKPDLTLRELRESLTLECSVQALHVVLVKMGLTYKKRHSAPGNKTVPTLPKHAGTGSVDKRRSIRRG